MIETTITKIQYDADGVQRRWSIPFQYADAKHISIYTKVGEEPTVKVVDNYDIDEDDSVVIYPTIASGQEPVVAGTKIIIARETPETQLEDASQVHFTSKDVERGLDKLTMITQELSTTAGETMEVSVDAFEAAEEAVSTANEANVTAGEAKTLAEQAVSVANDANDTATAANTKSNTAIKTANDANEKSTAAVSTANAAKTVASEANSTANNANTTATEAKEIASAANTTANNADKIANEADKKADNAVIVATNAKSIAEGIDAKATQALTNSTTALEKATEAKNTADSYQEQITTIEGKIPQAASDSNQLVDKASMTSAIAEVQKGVDDNAGDITALQADLAGKQDKITSTSKLSADLIADGTTNKMVTAVEKATWNNKQNAISDLDDIRSGAAKGATALQSYTETDPTVPTHVKAITVADISSWNNKQPAGDYATNTALTNGLASKANKATTLVGYGITDAFTKEEVNTELGKKADKATTYSKTEVDNAINSLQMIKWVDTLPETGESKYIYAVPREETDTDGKQIAALYLWDGSAWRGAGAFSLNIDPDTLATKAELAGYLPLASKAVANGVASLDANAKVPVAQIPDLSSTYATINSLATVATSGSYNDLTNKPTIPSVGNAEIEIQKNGAKVDSFTLNQTLNKIINITVPTKASDLAALPDSTKYAASMTLSIDSDTYVITAQLKDQDGANLGTAQTIDLPLESVVVSGSYDNANKKIVLTLESGSTIDVPVGDLIIGLQTEITTTNKLSADLVADGTTNKVVTATEKAAWNGKQDAIADLATIRSGASAGATAVQPGDLATVATSGMYSDLTGIPGAATANTLGLVKPDGTTITVTKDGTISATGGSSPSVDLTGYYNRDNLLGADEIEIVPEPVESGIDSHTMGCWHFDGNNENAVDGSVMTSSSKGFDTNGKFGSCAKTPTFTGWMPTSSDDYTWDFWFKTSTITGYDNGQVGGIGNYSGGYKYGCFYKQNEKLYAVRKGDSSIAEQPFATLQENVWTHLALTRQNNIERWFVNGKLIRQGENTYNATANQSFKSATNADFGRTDEYRISDIARWTEDFEPPTKPYSVAVPTGNYVIRNKTKLVHKSDIGVANGVAGLDASGKVPAEQIPTGSGFDFEGTKAEFNAAVAAGTITADSVSLITDDVSGDNVATKAELQDKVSKAGDTMTGELKMSGVNQIKFGTDDNFYYVKKDSIGNLSLYGNNNKGLFLQAEDLHTPYYFDGTKGFRLLTTADLQSLQTQINSLNTEVTGMLGRMNFNARVDFSLNHGDSYTVPSKGFLWINSITGTGGTAYINNGALASVNNDNASAYVRAFVPISAGDVLSASRESLQKNVLVSGFFVPQI